MRKAELQGKIAKQRKLASWAARCGTVSIVMAIILQNQINKKFPQIHIEYPASRYFLITAVLIIAAVVLGVTFSNFRRIGLCCMKCGKNLDKRLGELALTTGKCGKCGETMIEEDKGGS